MLPDSHANTVPVALGERSYVIQLYKDVKELAARVKEFCAEGTVLITNEAVWSSHGDVLLPALKAEGIDPLLWMMGDGEKFKSVDTAAAAWDFMVENRLTRKTCVLAFGGGVVGDLAGFVAATFLRGVPFVQIPTTVVAMVDSSVGGKTGVDHPLAKNLIGAFYQPRHVAVYPGFLDTLDEHNLRGGMAEVIKYGVIYDAEFFAWLEQNIEAVIRLEPDAVTHVIRRSCEIKADVVSQDEHENGLRAILNYGHTFGHAIEALGEYKEVQFHGQAVAIGMACAADMAVKLGMIDLAVAERIGALIERAGLPQRINAGIDIEEVYNRMFSDKKVAAGKIRFVLPTRIGEVTLRGDISRELVLETLRGRQD